ncbi:hypothetical protein SAMN04488005_0457 [Yoonia tamlensis]|uniref:Uncharacterized protein n=1 Tax=Yoonia tamlensis TaxID=390270 RepID=A0A1I6FTJ8_9RHOB|nr:hypothetical protein [Yoonia tamlensis]SFR33228.1 hypothetical protein SAMN04488005_0457 [Yoonia tamlensis]
MEYRHGVEDANQSTSNLMTRTSGFTAVVGGGSLEVTAGHGMTVQRGIEHSTVPQANAQGLVFSTEAGTPVPGGKPRPNDLVEIGGMKVKVAQAVRDGLIADPATAAMQAPYSAPNVNPQVQQQVPQGEPQQAPQSAADDFTSHVLPNVSPATVNSIEADLMEGVFSEKTTDYLMLEGGLNHSALAGVRDAYAAKITAATGLNEGELEQAYNSDREGFAKAVSELMKTGSTSAFQSIAQQAEAAAWTPLDTDAAMTAWQSPDFPQALIDAGLEPVFDGGEVSINIPNRGVVKWTDAVAQGLVKVSRT